MQGLIDQLNKDARALVIFVHQVDPVRALELSAELFDLTEVVTEGSCRIYRTPEGELINCWVEGSNRIESGGLGFDDQVEWYTGRTDEENA